MKISYVFHEYIFIKRFQTYAEKILAFLTILPINLYSLPISLIYSFSPMKSDKQVLGSQGRSEFDTLQPASLEHSEQEVVWSERKV